MSLFTGLTTELHLGGFFGMSSYLLMGDKIKDLVPANSPNKDIPVWMGHGEADPLVKFEWGKLTAQEIEKLGWKIEFNSYP